MQRYEAWWECAILDRPLVSIIFPKPEVDRVPCPPLTDVRWNTEKVPVWITNVTGLTTLEEAETAIEAISRWGARRIGTHT